MMPSELRLRFQELLQEAESGLRDIQLEIAWEVLRRREPYIRCWTGINIQPETGWKVFKRFIEEPVECDSELIQWECWVELEDRFDPETNVDIDTGPESIYAEVRRVPIDPGPYVDIDCRRFCTMYDASDSLTCRCRYYIDREEAGALIELMKKSLPIRVFAESEEKIREFIESAERQPIFQKFLRSGTAWRLFLIES